jgi:crotonobetainyl-CoA:carnitine CoA-transferase CaiB-like acyl-CoA transferase
MHEYAVQCYTLSGGEVLPEQTGHDMPTSTLYGVFRAADRDLVIAAQVDDSWKRFATLVERCGGPAGFGSDTVSMTSMAATRTASRSSAS